MEAHNVTTLGILKSMYPNLIFVIFNNKIYGF